MLKKEYLDFVKIFFLAILMVNVLFVVLTIFWTTDAPYSEGDMAHIRLGFPLDFVSQNQSRHNLPTLPKYRNVGFGSPLEDGLTLYWPPFFLNIAIMQLILVTVFFVIYTKLPKTQKFFRFLSVKYISIMLLLLIVITFGAFVY